MAQRGAPDGWDPPSVLRVTVESAPSHPRLRLRAGGARGRAAAIGLVAAIAFGYAVLALGGAGGARHGSVRIASAYAPDLGPAVHMRGVGQLITSSEPYRFPLGCMGLTITPRELAGVVRERIGPCWHYGMFVTAVLRRVGGVWRLGLEATSRSCPRVALPPAVRAQVLVCRR